MSQIKPDLAHDLQAHQDATFHLIIRTAGDATPHLDWLKSHGVEVTRQFKLSPGVAARCQGRAALSLVDVAWVVSIERDSPVKAI